MSAFDSIKNLANKAKDAATANSEKFGDAVDKAGDFVDSKTGGKYADKIDKAQDAAKKFADDGKQAAEGAPEAAPQAEAAPQDPTQQ